MYSCIQPPLFPLLLRFSTNCFPTSKATLKQSERICLSQTASPIWSGKLLLFVSFTELHARDMSTLQPRLSVITARAPPLHAGKSCTRSRSHSVKLINQRRVLLRTGCLVSRHLSLLHCLFHSQPVYQVYPSGQATKPSTVATSSFSIPGGRYATTTKFRPLQVMVAMSSSSSSLFFSLFAFLRPS